MTTVAAVDGDALPGVLRTLGAHVPAAALDELYAGACTGCRATIADRLGRQVDLRRLRRPGRPLKAALRGAPDELIVDVWGRLVHVVEWIGRELVGDDAYDVGAPADVRAVTVAAESRYGLAVTRIWLELTVADEGPAATAARDLLDELPQPVDGPPTLPLGEAHEDLGDDRLAVAPAQQEGPPVPSFTERDRRLLTALAVGEGPAAVLTGPWPSAFRQGFDGDVAAGVGPAAADRSWRRLGLLVRSIILDGPVPDWLDEVGPALSGLVATAVPPALNGRLVERLLDEGPHRHRATFLAAASTLDPDRVGHVVDELVLDARRRLAAGGVGIADAMLDLADELLHATSNAVPGSVHPGDLAPADRRVAIATARAAGHRARGSAATALRTLDAADVTAAADLEHLAPAIAVERALATLGLKHIHHAERRLLRSYPDVALGRALDEVIPVLEQAAPHPVASYLLGIHRLRAGDSIVARQRLDDALRPVRSAALAGRWVDSARLLRGLAALEVLEPEYLAGALDDVEQALDSGAGRSAGLRERLGLVLDLHTDGAGVHRAGVDALVQRLGRRPLASDPVRRVAVPSEPGPPVLDVGPVAEARTVAPQPPTAVISAPRSCAAVLELVGRHLPDIVVATQVGEGVAALDEHRDAPLWAEKAWRAMRCLQSYVDVKLAGQPGDLTTLLRTGELDPAMPVSWWTPHESERTNSNGRFRRARTLPVTTAVARTGSVYMPAHIKLVPGGMPAPRIHLHDDVLGKTGKVHIGHFGAHLENARTN